MLDQTDLNESQFGDSDTIPVDYADDFARMIEAIAVVDAAVTTLSAPLLTPIDLLEAHRIHAQLVDLPVRQPSAGFSALCDALHDVLVARCPNGRLRELLDEEVTILHAAHPPVELSSRQRRQMIDEHARLIELIELDPHSEAIAGLMRQHRQLCH